VLVLPWVAGTSRGGGFNERMHDWLNFSGFGVGRSGRSRIFTPSTGKVRRAVCHSVASRNNKETREGRRSAGTDWLLT